jgi:hypothetical protein
MSGFGRLIFFVAAALVVGALGYLLGSHNKGDSVPVGFTATKQPMYFSSSLQECTSNCDIHVHLVEDPTAAASCDNSDYPNCIKLNDISVTPEPCSTSACNYDKANLVVEWKQDQ